jgi:threonine/homoserine/homoserine lactone efflux protein
LLFKAVITGIGVGLLLAFLIGPAFFAIIQTSIHRGFKYGVVFASGVMFSDAFFAILAFLGISKFLHNEHISLTIGIIGGAFLIVYGISLWYKKPKNIVKKKGSKQVILKYFSSGFLLNTLNPAVVIYWVGMISTVGMKFSMNKLYVVPFILGSIGTVFVTDIAKSFLAAKLQRILKLRILFWMNRIIGLILMAFGIVMLLYVLIS